MSLKTYRDGVEYESYGCFNGLDSAFINQHYPKIAECRKLGHKERQGYCSQSCHVITWYCPICHYEYFVDGS